MGRGRDERGREGERKVGKGRGGKREGRDGGGRGSIGPLFSWRRHCLAQIWRRV